MDIFDDNKPNITPISSFGEFKLIDRLTNDVNPGIIVSTLGYWRQHNEGTVNSISSAEFANMGNAPTFSDNLVEVTKA